MKRICANIRRAWGGLAAVILLLAAGPATAFTPGPVAPFSDRLTLMHNEFLIEQATATELDNGTDDPVSISVPGPPEIFRINSLDLLDPVTLLPSDHISSVIGEVTMISFADDCVLLCLPAAAAIVETGSDQDISIYFLTEDAIGDGWKLFAGSDIEPSSAAPAPPTVLFAFAGGLAWLLVRLRRRLAH